MATPTHSGRDFFDTGIDLPASPNRAAKACRGVPDRGHVLTNDSGEEPAIFFTRGGEVGGYLSLGGVEIKTVE
jgi:hypothetical protein